MIVCPNCRTVNEEERTECERCGRSLEPGPTLQLAPRRPEGQAEPPAMTVRDLPRPSPARPFVVLGVLGAVVIGVVGFLLFRPDPCRGTNFTSTNFGYCLDVPEGWSAQPARFGSDVTLDQFSPPKATTTVVVEAVDLSSGTGLDQWAGFVEQKDQDSGLIPGDPSELRLDGLPAMQWDVSATADDGTKYEMREVVVVRDDVGWRVTLNDAQGTFDASSAQFQRMLDSWRFR